MGQIQAAMARWGTGGFAISEGSGGSGSTIGGTIGIQRVELDGASGAGEGSGVDSRVVVGSFSVFSEGADAGCAPYLKRGPWRS